MPSPATRCSVRSDGAEVSKVIVVPDRLVNHRRMKRARSSCSLPLRARRLRAAADVRRRRQRRGGAGACRGRCRADRGPGRLAGAQCAGRPARRRAEHGAGRRAIASTCGSTTSSKGSACSPTTPSAANAARLRARYQLVDIAERRRSCSTRPPARTPGSTWSAPNMRRSPPSRPRSRTSPSDVADRIVTRLALEAAPANAACSR